MAKTKTFQDYEADIRKFHVAGDFDKASMKVENIDFVICKVCGKQVGIINNTHLSTHNMTFEEYKSCFPDACVIPVIVSKKMKGPRHHIRGENSQNWIKRIKMICKWCGAKYETEARYENRSHFCSKQCRFDYDSNNLNGANNPNWKGGISPERQCLYASRIWHEAIDTVTQRDLNICQKCGVTTDDCKRLEIHHIIPFEVKQCRTNPDNLTTLCAKCHGWVHSSKNTDHEFIGEVPNDAP